MSRTTQFSKRAQSDLIDIAWFVARQSGSADVGSEFADNLRARCERIARLPGMLGSPRPEIGHDIRSSPHKGYLILFRYVHDAVEIVTVLNGRRDIAALSVDDDTTWS